MTSLALGIPLVIAVIVLVGMLIRDTKRGPVYLNSTEVGQLVFVQSKQEESINVIFEQNNKEIEVLIPEGNKDNIEIQKKYTVKKDTQNKIYLSEKI